MLESDEDVNRPRVIGRWDCVSWCLYRTPDSVHSSQFTPKSSKKNLSQTTSSTRKTTQTGPGLNLGLCSDRLDRAKEHHGYNSQQPLHSQPDGSPNIFDLNNPHFSQCTRKSTLWQTYIPHTQHTHTHTHTHTHIYIYIYIYIYI